jgi:hypothetical protein
VYGISYSGAGVIAETSGPGTALEVAGPAVFSQSGLATVPSGKSQVVVAVPGLTARSFVLATVQQSGRALVKAAIPNVTDGTVTLQLNGKKSSPTMVGWFVANY